MALSWSPIRFWLQFTESRIGRKLLAEVIFGDHPGERCCPFQMSFRSPRGLLPSGRITWSIAKSLAVPSYDF